MFRLYLSVVVLCLSPVATYSAPSQQIKDEIINRCRTTLNDYGASTVKYCVDQDVSAYNQLATYSSEWTDIIQRCKGQLLSMGGWSTVKYCADQDISAEKALRDM